LYSCNSGYILNKCSLFGVALILLGYEKMPDWTKAQEKEALAVVSSLKRALGVPNHPDRKDEFADGKVHIYTTDASSAKLIGELLWRYGNGPRAAFYDAHPEKFTLRDTVAVNRHEDGGYEASMWILYPPAFTKAMQKMFSKYIGPDKTFSR
jgi:hypothetical protein